MTRLILDPSGSGLTTTNRTINFPADIKDYKKVNKTRRRRGYNFEYRIVNAFNDHKSKDWHARRLGGSSTGLPDIVVTNNEKSILYAIECKSGESNILYIPRDQIDRCKDITDKLLKTYKTRHIVFAFKFKSNKKKGSRKLQYRFVIYDALRYSPNLTFIAYNIKEDLIFSMISGDMLTKNNIKRY